MHVGCGLHTELKNVLQGRNICNKTITQRRRLLSQCKSPPDRRVLSDSILVIECTRILIAQYAKTCLENLILHVKFDVMLLITLRDNDMINLKQRG